MTSGERSPGQAARRYLVYRQGTLVLEIAAEPGPLLSKKAPPPPPGERAVTHPFLSATAHVPEYEGVLREALDKSASLEEYLAALRSQGFRVEEVQPS